MKDDVTIDDVFDVESPYYSGAAIFPSTLASKDNPFVGDNGYVLSTGQVVFKNVSIGGATLQYQVGDGGIFSFGDGSDSDAQFKNQGTAPTGSTKTDNTNGATIYRLDRDVYYADMTVDATVTVNPNGYRIFVNKTCLINGTVSRNGTAGTNGSTSNGGGSVSLADGYLKGSAATGAGANASGNDQNGSNGSNGTDVANCLSTGVAGNGGDGGDSSAAPLFTGGTGGTVGTTTASNVKLIANWHLATLLDISSTGATVKFNSSGTAGGGGGGADKGAGGSEEGGGGAGGANGGIVAIYAKILSISSTGSITANGGNGGNGGNATGESGGGGGGGGGAGGVIVLVYNSSVNSGSVTASGGTGGAAGTGAGSGGETAGTDGGAGIIYQFALSL